MNNKTETTIRDVIILSRYSLFEFSVHYDVPYRTLCSWSSGSRTPPKYVVTALLRCVLCDLGYCINKSYNNKESL